MGWRLVILATVLLAFALYTFDLAGQGLWMDEIITVRRCNQALPQIMRNLFLTRNHVPLYFVLMHVWQKGGDGEFWVRFPSVVWAILGLALTVRLARDVAGDRWTGTCAGLLLALAPFYNWHARDARMYTMVAFWVNAATWTLIRAWRNRGWGWWFSCGVCVLVAAFTHLLAPVVFLGQAFVVILRRRGNRLSFRRWFLTMALAAVPFLVWLLALGRSGGFATAYISWIPRPTPLDLPLTYYVLSVGSTAGYRNGLTYLPLVLHVVLISVLIWRRRCLARQQRWALTVLGLGVAFMPPMVWLASQRQPIYVDRYFLPLVPSMIVLVVVGLRMVGRWRRGVAWSVFVLLLVFDGWSLVNLHFDPLYALDDWRGAAAYVRSQAASTDGLLTYADHPFYYYSPGELTPQDAWAVMEDPQIYAERTAQVVSPDGRLWLVLPLTVLNNHGFFEERQILAKKWVDRNPYVQWLVENRELLDTKRLSGIQVMLFGPQHE